MLHIVLLEPEIPPNTGNIVRTCAAVGACLHLIEPLGFLISDSSLKRAGLDYWDKTNLQIYADLEDFFEKTNCAQQLWLVSTKGSQSYHQVAYQKPCWLMFGRETRGLPMDLLYKYSNQVLRLPMKSNIRSLNLANSVAVMAYEVMRQWNFVGLELGGSLSSIDTE